MSSFEKNCNKCNEPIKLVKTGAGWKPQNIDGSFHECQAKRPQSTRPIQPATTLDQLVRAIVREELGKMRA